MRRRELFELLARALDQPAALAEARLSSVDLVTLVELAERHRVAAPLAASFVAAGLDVPEQIANARRVTTLSHLQHLRALQLVAGALDGAGIAWLVIKGPALAVGWYGDPAMRRYYDLDVLVDPVRLSDGLDALAAAGFAECNKNWEGFRSLGLGEVPLTDGTVTLDLHWHLVTFASNRPSFRFPTAEILERRVPIALGSVSAASLGDDDMLSHVLLHAGLAGARQLIHLRDVHVVASGVDWEAGRRLLVDRGLERIASAVVNRAEHLLGPIGSRHRAPSLHSPAWRGLNEGLDRGWATALPNGEKAYPSALLSAGRPTVGGTVREIGTQLVTSVRRHAGIPTITSPGGPLDWDLDAGGPAERARFLRDVQTGVFGH